MIARREVLKLGAMAAVAAGAAGAGLRLAGDAGRAFAANAPEDEILIGGNFRVEIQGCPVASSNVQSISIEDLTIDSRETTSGQDIEYRQYAPGDAHYGKVTIGCVVPRSQTNELRQWIEDAAMGNDVRKDISIVILKRDGSEARTFNLLQCYPVRWDPGEYSPSSRVAVETLTCTVGMVELG